MQLVTKAQYAAMNDWDKSYLSKKDIIERLAPAMTPDPQKPEKKLVDVEKADLIFKITRDPSRYLNEPKAATPPGATPSQETFTDAKRDLTLVRLEHERLDLAQRRGELLDRQSVYQAAALAGQSIRLQLTSLSRQVSEKAAPMTDARAIKAMIDEEIRSILETVSHDFMRSLGPAAEEGDQDTTH